jgi:hypothetical protein
MKKSSTTDLEKKLGKYSAMAGALIASAGVANAQVIYTDVNPDVTLNGAGQNYLLDLNNDGTDDFDILMDVRAGTYGGGLVNYTVEAAGINPLSSNEVMGTAATIGGAGTYAQVVGGGDMIDDAAGWGVGNSDGMVFGGWATATGLISSSAAVGDWANETDKYVGLKLNSGGSAYYGWARLDMVSTALGAVSITIKDYAYESTAATGVVTDPLVGLDDNALDGVNIAQVGDKIIVDVDANIASQGTVTVMNLNGQAVQEEQLGAGMKVLQTEGLAAGLYLVTARFNEGVITEKVMVK